jgi:hypothetical protein
MISTIETYIIVGLLALTGALGLSTMEYRRLYQSEKIALKAQNTMIEQQKKAAAAEIAELNKQAEAQRLALLKSTRKLVENENDFNDKLTAMRHTVDAQPPYRVRIVTRSAGDSGGSAKGGTAANSASGAGQATTATGLLDQTITANLRQFAYDVETLQRDFNTCRADIIRRVDDGNHNN